MNRPTTAKSRKSLSVKHQLQWNSSSKHVSGLSNMYMQQQYNDVELSAFGIAMVNIVIVAEILKNSGFAVEKSV
ncbi:hypothetical protein F2Q68_00011377 [Brassica cretica]|uniref:Uncharacterized protein n=1 Tax=Brassica cretica TaxID=69181 RepID=A0A8S9KTG5_BRACR|nr:hypothetical protein F2Q68_00011377 [Brassica cretica]